MRYKIYVVGKIQDKNHKDAIAEYAKRLTRYCKTNLIEVKNITQLEKKVSDKSYVIKLSAKGENPSSEELAEKIKQLGLDGNSDISIVITNEAIGFDEHLSLSTMEMSLGMTATVLYEQIYRAYRIINNQSYHK